MSKTITHAEMAQKIHEIAEGILERESARRALAKARAPWIGRSAWKRERDRSLALSGGRILLDQTRLEEFWAARGSFFQLEADDPVRKAVEAALALELVQPCGAWELVDERDVA